MRTWAFVSQKGGVGKSLLCTQLAAYAEQCGEAVCIFDLDPQGSCMAWSQVRGTREPTVVAIAANDVPGSIAKAPNFGISLILIDTPGYSDAPALAAIRAADLVVCPTRASLFDVAALKDTVALLDLAGMRDKAYGVVNGLPGKTFDETYEEARTAIRSLGLSVLNQGIGYRQPYVTAIGRGKGVTEPPRAKEAETEIIKLWTELNTLAPIRSEKGAVR